MMIAGILDFIDSSIASYNDNDVNTIRYLQESKLCHVP